MSKKIHCRNLWNTTKMVLGYLGSMIIGTVLIQYPMVKVYIAMGKIPCLLAKSWFFSTKKWGHGNNRSASYIRGFWMLLLNDSFSERLKIPGNVEQSPFRSSLRRKRKSRTLAAAGSSFRSLAVPAHPSRGRVEFQTG